MSDRKLNNWCPGIRLPDGNNSGCACDCPTCKTTALKLAALEAAMTVDDTVLAESIHHAVIRGLGLLGQFTDLAVVRRGGLKTDWFCMYCKDSAPTPDQVKHKHNCLVARSKEYLEKHRR